MLNDDRFFSMSAIPLPLKLWFGFVAVVAISLVALCGWAIWAAASDPASIGRFAGEIAHGFNEAASGGRQ